MSGGRPTWIRLDVDWFDAPKLLELRENGCHSAAVLWLLGLSYCAKHLTDGWVPASFPGRNGHKPKDAATLVEHELWHPVDPALGTLMDTHRNGWLVNDYLDYQPSRDEWERTAAKRRAAARKRWGT